MKYLCIESDYICNYAIVVFLFSPSFPHKMGGTATRAERCKVVGVGAETEPPQATFGPLSVTKLLGNFGQIHGEK